MKRRFRRFFYIAQRAHSGFTIVELIVAMSVFSILITIAIGGFTRALQTQRQASALIAVASNVSEVIEQAARELRTGKDFCISSTFDCNGSVVSCGVNEAVFTNTRDELVRYDAQGGSLRRTAWGLKSGSCVIDGPHAVTASNVDVAAFRVVVQGSDAADQLKPRITISISIRPKDASLQNFPATTLQTTVSSRFPSD